MRDRRSVVDACAKPNVDGTVLARHSANRYHAVLTDRVADAPSRVRPR